MIYIPFTRACGFTTMSGVPVGMHDATPSCNNTGTLLDLTRNAEVVNIAVKHGPLPAGGGGKAHPLISYIDVATQIPIPEILTRDDTISGDAVPPCAHVMIALLSKRYPGTT